MGKFTLPLTITLDETFKFELHIGKLEQKAQKTKELLRKMKGTEAINTSFMLQLYTALVTPQLENAAAVWQIRNYDELEKVQRKGQALCVDVPVTAGLEVLEVEAPRESIRRIVC